jgi:enoyl-CoA hydratase/carnithine racemase
MRLVSQSFPDKQSMMARVEALAADIAGKSPLAITGTKRILLHAR